MLHLHHGGSHRLDASRHNRADARDLCIASQHLGEALDHPSRDGPALLLTIARELAPAPLGIVHDEFHLLEYTLTRGGEFVDTAGMGNHLIGDVESLTTADITRPMTPVVLHLMSQLSQLTQAIGLCKYLIRLLIQGCRLTIIGARTAIMIDIEGLLTLRRRSIFRHLANGTSIMKTCGTIGIGLQLLGDLRLSTYLQRHKHGHDNQAHLLHCYYQ